MPADKQENAPGWVTNTNPVQARGTWQFCREPVQNRSGRTEVAAGKGQCGTNKHEVIPAQEYKLKKGK